MNIPDKAMDAAFRAATGDAELHLDDRMYWEQVARDMLEAAAPFIAAQALKDHATAVVTHHVNATPAFFEGMKFAALQAMDRAFDMEEEQ